MCNSAVTERKRAGYTHVTFTTKYEKKIQGEYLYLRYLNDEIRPCGDHNFMWSYSIQKDPNISFSKKGSQMIVSFLTTCSRQWGALWWSLVPLSWRVTVWMCCRWGPDPALPWWCSHHELCLLFAVSWVGHILCGQGPRQWSWASQVMPPSWLSFL